MRWGGGEDAGLRGEGQSGERGAAGGEREMEAVSLPCTPPHTQHFEKMSFQADGYARLESGLGDQRCGRCHGLHPSRTHFSPHYQRQWDSIFPEPAFLITINGNETPSFQNPLFSSLSMAIRLHLSRTHFSHHYQWQWHEGSSPTAELCNVTLIMLYRIKQQNKTDGNEENHHLLSEVLSKALFIASHLISQWPRFIR